LKLQSYHIILPLFFHQNKKKCWLVKTYDILFYEGDDIMFHPIKKPSSKDKLYNMMLDGFDSFLIKSDSLITNLSNTSAYLNYYLDDINWIGFYLYDGSKLYLGPFQGLPACTYIQLGSGVCGTAAENKRTLIVPNVDEFPGHIACDSQSKSEIVVPLISSEGKLRGVLDIDSPNLNRFDQIDKYYLEQLANKLVDIIW
jgi:GAF domain-containing protein